MENLLYRKYGKLANDLRDKFDILVEDMKADILSTLEKEASDLKKNKTKVEHKSAIKDDLKGDMVAKDHNSIEEKPSELLEEDIKMIMNCLENSQKQT